ncbi:hypothetical protein C1H46_037654 [Malus baccata]|uniref:Uncharacterized protein n=1 Tax=Malus baccata TaxID=106549 RepID=A0A540KRG7_MALBA|nr:hypothetical protein C1H46_037654 [Malus baccata]
MNSFGSGNGTMVICWWDKFHLDHLKPNVFKALRILPDRQCAIEPSRSTLESSSSKIVKLKSLIESSPSCSKKDLKDKVLKILELDGLDDEEMRSEAASSQHNMDEYYRDDNEDVCYEICPPIRPKKSSMKCFSLNKEKIRCYLKSRRQLLFLFE